MILKCKKSLNLGRLVRPKSPYWRNEQQKGQRLFDGWVIKAKYTLTRVGQEEKKKKENLLSALI